MHSLRSFIKPETIYFIIIWLACLAVFRDRGFYDPGSLWHIRVGEIILTEGFPWTDPFTYTFAGHTWIPQQWGGEVIMALAHRLGGLDTALLLFSTLVALLSTWLFSRMRSAGLHSILAAILTGGCLFAAAFHFCVRPHMATIVLLAWTFACIVDYERGKVSNWRLASLIPLFAIWTNIHGGVLGGVMTIGLAVAGWGVLFLLGYDSPIRSWRQAWLLAGIVIACALTPFLNPFGMEMLNTWQRIVGSDILKVAVNEHKPLNLANDPDRVVFGVAIGYLFLLLGIYPKRPQITWLIPFVWLGYTVTSIRQGPLFAVVATVAIADLWPHTIWHRLLKKHGDSLIIDPPDPQAGVCLKSMVLPAILVIVSLSMQLDDREYPFLGKNWVQLDPDCAPVEMNEPIRQGLRDAGPTFRLYNDANLGGYLIYHLPEIKIFMDDRFEMYGDQWTRDYVECFWNQPERFDVWDQEYRFNMALVQTDKEPSTLDKYISSKKEQWQEVKRSERVVLFKKIKPK